MRAHEQRRISSFIYLLPDEDEDGDNATRRSVASAMMDTALRHQGDLGTSASSQMADGRAHLHARRTAADSLGGV